MKSKAEIEQSNYSDFPICNPELIVDLRDVSIDCTKSVMDRIDSFLNQVKNPYLLRVDDIIIKVNYRGERNLSDALTSLLLMG